MGCPIASDPVHGAPCFSQQSPACGGPLDTWYLPVSAYHLHEHICPLPLKDLDFLHVFSGKDAVGVAMRQEPWLRHQSHVVCYPLVRMSLN